MKSFDQIPPQKDCYKQFELLCKNAMKALLLDDETSYIETIQHLAKTCAILKQHYAETITSLVSTTERYSVESYQIWFRQVKNDVKDYQQKIKENHKTSAYYTEKDNADIKQKVAVLEKILNEPLSHHIEGIVTDMLNKAYANYAMQIDENFSVMEYKFKG